MLGMYQYHSHLENPSEWIVEDFPIGYELYDHHKEQLNRDMRHDIYLFGSLLCLDRFPNNSPLLTYAWSLLNPGTTFRP